MFKSNKLILKGGKVNEKSGHRFMKIIVVTPLILLLVVGMYALLKGVIGGGFLLIGFLAFVIWITWEPAIRPILFGEDE